MIDQLTALARERGAYKVILDCSDNNAAFYERCGFVRKSVHMALYFPTEAVPTPARAAAAATDSPASDAAAPRAKL
jgi:hypothetical protein